MTEWLTLSNFTEITDGLQWDCGVWCGYDKACAKKVAITKQESPHYHDGWYLCSLPWESSSNSGFWRKNLQKYLAETQRQPGAVWYTGKYGLRIRMLGFWSLSEPQFPFLYNEVVRLGYHSDPSSSETKQKLEDAGGQGRNTLCSKSNDGLFVSVNQTRHRKLSIFIPELVGVGGVGVLAVVSPHLTTQPSAQGPCRHTMGSCLPWGFCPWGEGGKDKMGQDNGEGVWRMPAARWKQGYQPTLCLASKIRIKGSNFIAFIWS